MEFFRAKARGQICAITAPRAYPHNLRGSSILHLKAISSFDVLDSSGVSKTVLHLHRLVPVHSVRLGPRPNYPPVYPSVLAFQIFVRYNEDLGYGLIPNQHPSIHEPIAGSAAM